MKNLEIAKIFYEIANILEMENVQWKPIAYRRAAKAIEIARDVEEIYEKQGIKGLEEIPGVGQGLAKKIIQYIEKGKIEEYERLKKKIPRGISELMQVPGLGAKRALFLYKKLGIKTVKQLEEAAKAHKISKLPTLKEKTEGNILQGIEFMRKSGKEERKLLGLILPTAKQIENNLRELKEIEKVSLAGSIRRMKETIRDIDILVTTKNPSKVIDFFTKMKNVSRVLAKGSTKAEIITKEGLQVDLRVVDDECYGSALQYFTGNKEHNIKLRKFAIKKGLKISEYGVFKGRKRIAGKTEEEVYKKLNLPYMEPEIREDNGEIEAALKNKLPDLIGYNDIKGDLHVHTKWSDGDNSIEEMANSAKALNYSYLAICDHAGNLKIAHSLNEKRLEKQIKEIDKLNNKLEKRDFKVLKGTEVDIKASGELSLSNSLLKKLDIVTASIHSGFKASEAEMTSRILKALDNSYVNVLGHPTGRIIQKREPYKVDLGKIFDKAKQRNIALEINAFPDRLDLNELNVKTAVEKKVKLAIGTDSHSKEQLKFLMLGIAVARRGWATKNDVINCLSLDRLLKFLKR